MGSVAMEGFGASGGAALNLKVVGGLIRPAAPKENTLWAITEHKITSWSFAASIQSDLVEGMVIITTGTFSAVEFNALKKNTIMVYPVSAKQCIEGTLVNVSAEIYQGGEWHSLDDGTLFFAGNQYESITGGWTVDEYTYTNTVNGSIDDKINIVKTSSDSTSCIVGTVNKIDLTNTKTIFAEASSVSGGYKGLCVATSKDTKQSSVAYVELVVGTASLDVSSLTGEYYIYVYGIRCAAVVDKIWREFE